MKKEEDEMVLRHKVIGRHESLSRRLGISTHKHERKKHAHTHSHTTTFINSHTSTHSVRNREYLDANTLCLYVSVYIHKTFFFIPFFTHIHTNALYTITCIYKYCTYLLNRHHWCCIVLQSAPSTIYQVRPTDKLCV